MNISDNPIDKRIHEFLDKYVIYLMLILLLCVSFLIRKTLAKEELLSVLPVIAAEYFMSFLMFCILKGFISKIKAAFISLLFLFLPFSFMNSCMLRLKTAVFICILLLGIYLYLKGHYVTALISFALSVFEINIPKYAHMTDGGLNVYSVGYMEGEAYFYPAILFCAAVILFLAYYFLIKGLYRGTGIIYMLACISFSVMLFFPGQSVSSDYAASVLLILSAAVYKNKWLFISAFIVNFCSIMNYCKEIFYISTVPMYGIIYMLLAAYIMLIYFILYENKAVDTDKKAALYLNGRYLHLISLSLIYVLALYIRLILVPRHIDTGDYATFLVPWIASYREFGIVKALSMGVGNYYVPYNLLLALSSVLPLPDYVSVALYSYGAEFISCIFIYKMALGLLRERKDENAEYKALWIAGLSLLFPFTFLNSSIWKQCDAIYVMFVLISLERLMSKKYGASFVFLSIAFCFKLQTVFILPFYMLLYLLEKKFSIFQFCLIPVTYVICGLPAVLCGRNAKEVYLTYLSQANEYESMIMNAANIYEFGMWDYAVFKIPAILICVAVLAAGVSFIKKLYDKKKFDLKMYAHTALWISWTCFMFLPSMHERYAYLPALLLGLIFLVYKERLTLACMCAFNVSLVLTYATFLSGGIDVPQYMVAAPACISYFIYSYKMFKSDMFIS